MTSTLKLFLQGKIKFSRVEEFRKIKEGNNITQELNNKQFKSIKKKKDREKEYRYRLIYICLLYTSDAADDVSWV